MQGTRFLSKGGTLRLPLLPCLMVMFNKVYLVGVGLMNGSLAKDLKRCRLARVIVGVGRNSRRLGQARALGLIDAYQLLANADVSNADLIVLGVPVRQVSTVLALLKPSLRAPAIITDIGSTKRSVIQAAAEIFGELPPRLVPGHPIAGREASGFEHAQEHLFKDHKVILTPVEVTQAAAINSVKAMWHAVGAQVAEMSAARHDAILSATSHLPHLAAYTLVNCLGARPDAQDIFTYAAGGLTDFTRVASSDAAMWVDICLANKDQILASMAEFNHCLHNLRAAIERHDEDAIHSLFTHAKRTRDINLLKE